jgi:cytochrome c biogenesis protein CcdA
MNTPAEQQSIARNGASVLAIATLTIICVAIAFYGTEVYNFFIPTVIQKKDFSLGIWTLAVIGGVAGFLSPCAFGMLPYYFAFHLSASCSSENRGDVLRHSVRYGAAAALGMISFAVCLAILILILGATFAPSLRIVTPIPNTVTQTIRVVSGLVLIFLGVQQLRGRSVVQTLGGFFANAETKANELMVSDRPSLLAFYLFGLMYAIVAMPCVANVMAGPLLAATTLHGAKGAVLAEVLFLGTMSLLIFIASICFGLANKALIEKIESMRSTILKSAGLIMIMLGAVIIYLDLDTATFRQLFFAFPIK